jgi:hypothetical protein
MSSVNTSPRGNLGDMPSLRPRIVADQDVLKLQVSTEEDEKYKAFLSDPGIIPQAALSKSALGYFSSITPLCNQNIGTTLAEVRTAEKSSEEITRREQFEEGQFRVISKQEAADTLNDKIRKDAWAHEEARRQNAEDLKEAVQIKEHNRRKMVTENLKYDELKDVSALERAQGEAERIKILSEEEIRRAKVEAVRLSVQRIIEEIRLVAEQARQLSLHAEEAYKMQIETNRISDELEQEEMAHLAWQLEVAQAQAYAAKKLLKTALNHEFMEKKLKRMHARNFRSEISMKAQDKRFAEQSHLDPDEVIPQIPDVSTLRYAIFKTVQFIGVFLFLGIVIYRNYASMFPSEIGQPENDSGAACLGEYDNMLPPKTDRDKSRNRLEDIFDALSFT